MAQRRTRLESKVYRSPFLKKGCYVNHLHRKQSLSLISKVRCYRKVWKNSGRILKSRLTCLLNRLQVGIHVQFTLHSTKVSGLLNVQRAFRKIVKEYCSSFGRVMCIEIRNEYIKGSRTGHVMGVKKKQLCVIIT